MGSAGIPSYDAIVIGAGFSGMSALHKLRQNGLAVKVFEAGTDFGGVWHWNRYPGARVDSETPFYQLNIPEVYKTWNFSQRFPDHRELRRYMAHVDKTLDLRKDVEFEARVVDVSYSKEDGRWTAKTATGSEATGKYLILATGLLHRRHYPEFPGLSEFQGEVHHSGFWPEDLSVKGKKVAVIGAGATSVQIVQELAKEAEHLTMLMRRPSYCLPMGQRNFTALEQTQWKSYYERFFAEGRKSRSGFPNTPNAKKLFDVGEIERERLWEEIWARGGFNFTHLNYLDVVRDKKSNREVYNFWRKKVRARMTDPIKQDLMAPEEPPYWFGTKRTPLEHDYYEMLDKPSVEIVDLNKNPLKTFVPTGMVMDDGKIRELDMVVLATGFDSFTGSVCNMGLKNKNGVDMKESWGNGIHTYLGMLCSGFPNTFMVYSPQAPTALSNGPTILECQVDFVVETIAKLEKEKAKSIEPRAEAEDEWKALIQEMNAPTLFPLTSSWWTGGNIPGKKAESLTYVLGIDKYEVACRETLKDWKGFEVVSQ